MGEADVGMTSGDLAIPTCPADHGLVHDVVLTWPGISLRQLRLALEPESHDRAHANRIDRVNGDGLWYSAV